MNEFTVNGYQGYYIHEGLAGRSSHIWWPSDLSNLEDNTGVVYSIVIVEFARILCDPAPPPCDVMK